MSLLTEVLLTKVTLHYNSYGFLEGRSDDSSRLGKTVLQIASLVGKKDKALTMLAKLRTDRWERTRRQHPFGEYSFRHDVSPHPSNFV